MASGGGIVGLVIRDNARSEDGDAREATISESGPTGSVVVSGISERFTKSRGPLVASGISEPTEKNRRLP